MLRPNLPPKLVSGIALAALTILVSLSVAVPQPQAKKPRRPVRACQRFTSPSGRDSGRGTRQSPFRTAERLVRSLRPGQVGCLEAGVYRGDVHLLGAGRKGKRLTLRAAPGANATFCGFVEFMPAASFWRLTRLKVDGSCSPQNTIQVYADYAMLDHDDITNRHLGPSCVLVGYRAWAPQWVRIAHDRVHDCGHVRNRWDHAIYASSPRNAQITDNYVYDNSGYGIHLYADAQATVIERNVVDASDTQSGLVFGGSGALASSGDLVRHNIFTGNAKYGVTSSWGSRIGTGNVLDSNCFWQNANGSFPLAHLGFVPLRNVEADPKFISAANGNYRVAPRSPCRGMQPRGHVGP